MDLKKAGIIGCGLMGAGIAHTIARSGIPVKVYDSDPAQSDKGVGRIYSFIDKGIEKGKTTIAEKETVSRNLHKIANLRELSDCGIIIEAIPEDFQLKAGLFRELDKIVRPQVIFSSNTSSIKISELAQTTGRPDKFVGTHFFNPVPIMKLCEVIRLDETSDRTFTAVLNFIHALDKTAVVCRDTTGFVVNRLLTPYLLDAVRAFEAGVASVEDIDTGMMLGCGYPMGPLTLVDFVGVETVNHIADIMTEEFKLPQYEAPELLRKMVEKGWYGKKTGFGFYDYSSGEKRPHDDSLKKLLP